MIHDIDHVAIKVKSIDSCRHAFKELGFPMISVKRHDEVGMKIGFFGEGNSKLELMEVIDSGSPITGDPLGIHHVGMKVDDIEASFAAMNDSPLFSVEGNIRHGAHSRIFFFRLTGDPSTLYECVESGLASPERTTEI